MNPPVFFVTVVKTQREGIMEENLRTADQKKTDPEAKEGEKTGAEEKNKGINDDTRTRSDKMIGGAGKSVENKSE